MTRNVINKHNNSTIPPNRDSFYEGIPKELSDSAKDEIAKGIIFITNRAKHEGLYILNTSGAVKCVAQALDAELPPNVVEAISELSQDLKEYADETVSENITERLEEYNSIVVLSGTNLYNTLSALTETKVNAEKEELLSIISGLTSELNDLRYYVENLKISDHLLIKENAYVALRSEGSAYIDEEGNLLTEEDDGYGDENYYIEYSDDVYYCIPEEDENPPQSGESTTEISGNVMTVEFDIENDTVLVFDDTITISGNTAIISDTQQDTPSETNNVSGSVLSFGSDFEIENNHSVNGDFRIEDHTLIL